MLANVMVNFLLIVIQIAVVKFRFFFLYVGNIILEIRGITSTRVFFNIFYQLPQASTDFFKFTDTTIANVLDVVN